MSKLEINNIIFKKRKLPVIKQAQYSECGFACVAMICHYHGHDVDLSSLRTIQAPSMNGSSMLDLIQLLEKMHLSSRAIKVNLHELKHIQCPAILHWKMNHFVVLKSVHIQHIIIHDPAMGQRKITWHELINLFTGIVLEVEKTNDFSSIRFKKDLTVLDLFKGIQGLKKSLGILLLMSLTIEVITLVNPLLVQYITDNVTNSNGIDNLNVVVVGFFILIFSYLAIEFMRSHFVVYLTYHLNEYFSSGVMLHLLKVPFDYFEHRHKGDILSRFHAIKEIQTKLSTDAINALLDCLVIFFSLIIMAMYSIKLTCIVITALILYILLRLVSYQHHKKQTEFSIIEHANVNSKFLEIIQNIMSIKLYAREYTMFQKWKNHFIEALNADIKISRVNILYNIANIFIFNIEHIFVVAVGALLVLRREFSVGMLMAYLAYRQNLVHKSASFIQTMIDYKLISVQLGRVADILTQPTEKQEESRLIEKEIKGELRIENLHYQYNKNTKEILNNISFNISPGEKVVITGPSGVGKTTLLKIMLGLHTPSKGKILVDGIPITTLGIQKYRTICASVMQNDVLVSGSIFDNITFMESRINIEKVYAVSKIAQIHDDISNMPMSYETLIGDMGNTLSGGQKQRILIARALYKSPILLFLDEATSHLDIETEIKLNIALKNLNITQVIIAHRQESIKMADRVITLK